MTSRASHTRRLFLFRGMAGAAALAAVSRSAAAIAGANAPSCFLTSEQETGPFYLDLERIRQDITEGKPGVPLKLRITVVDGKRCTPIENAALDIWHCDAAGVYSGFTANGPGRPPGMMPGVGPPLGPPPGFDGPPPMPPPDFAHRKHDATTFLRGVQLTNRDGVVEFSTIYPGWYTGRDIHIHMRAHVAGQAKDAKYSGGRISYTGQLFFPDDVSDTVARQQPYSQHRTRRTRQSDDGVFQGQHGSGSIVGLTPVKKDSIEEGFVATAILGIDPDAHESL